MNNKPTMETAAAGFGSLLEMMKEKQSSWANAFATRGPIEVITVRDVLRGCFLSQAMMTQKSLCESNIGNMESDLCTEDLITWKESLITNAIKQKMHHLYECNDSIGHTSLTILTTDKSAVVLICSYLDAEYNATIFSFDVEHLNDLSNMIKGVQ